MVWDGCSLADVGGRRKSKDYSTQWRACMATLMPLVEPGTVRFTGWAVSMSGPIIAPNGLATNSAKPCCRYQTAHATLNLPPVVFTGWVLYCRVDMDSVHKQRCCHRMRAHSIGLPLGQWHLLHRRPWDLARR